MDDASPAGLLGIPVPPLDQHLHVLTRAETSLDIGRPAPEIFAYLSDFRRHVEWAHTYLAVTSLGGGPLEIGSKFEVDEKQDLRWDKLPFTTIASREGVDYKTELEVVDFRPAARLVWRAHVLGAPLAGGWGPFVVENEFVLDPVTDRITTLRMRGRLDGPEDALIRWLEELRSRGLPPDVVNRQLDRAMYNIRTILEGRAKRLRTGLASPAGRASDR